MDVHNYEKRLESVVRRIKASKEISRANRRLLLAFKDELLLELSVGRVARHLENMFNVARWLGKDLSRATKEDVKAVIAKLNSMPYSEWTRHFYKVSIRKFFKWLRKSEDYPPEVSWIKLTVKNNNHKLPEDILTPEEVKRLIACAVNLRDKALIAVLYESGCRIGELLSLRIKDVEFDEYGAKLMLRGKTGMRRIRIVSSAPLLADWINRHPMNSDPEALLWVSERSLKPVSYQMVRKMLKTSARKAGIRKRVYPHLLRHSRATHLANHLTEAQMKEFFGWTQSSRMASIYVHLSGRDLDNALLSIYGIKVRGKESDVLKPNICPRCRENNPPTNKYCSKCGMILDEAEAIKLMRRECERRRADEILDKLMNDEEFREMLINKVKSLLG